MVAALRLSAAAAAALALALAGCGVDMPDLLAAERTGQGAGARLSVVVNDGGTVRCNGGRERRLPSALLLDARAFVRDTEDDRGKNRSFPGRPGSVLAYRVRTEEGTVSWRDNSRVPEAYGRFVLTLRRIARGVCGLSR